MRNPTRRLAVGISVFAALVAALFGAKVAFASAAIQSLSPAAAPNEGSARVTINGSGFLPGASVRLVRSGQADVPGDDIVLGSNVSFDSMNKLRATFDLDTRSPGDWDVKVTQLDGTATCGQCFAVAADAPSVSTVSPASRGQGATDQQLTITGAHFARAASVQISGTGISLGNPTFVDAGHIAVVSAINGNAPTGGRDVTVTNTDGQSFTCDACFNVNASPNVASIAPNTRGQGATNQTIVVTGSNFGSGASASFGPGITVASTTVKTPESIEAKISVTSAATPGARDVIVTNGDGGTSAVCSGCFTVNAAPAAASASPSSRGQGAADQDITLTGNGFVDGATVSFSGTGITVNKVTYKPGTLTNDLVANVSIDPAATSNARDVTVTNPDGGSGHCVNCFTVNDRPSVSGVQPGSRGQGATDQVKITGSDFAPGAEAVFSGTGVTVDSTTYVSSHELRADLSIGSGAATGLRNLTVANSDGGAGACTECFTINAKPALSSVAPNALGQRASDQDIVLNGSSFADGATVAVAGTGITVNSVDFVDSTKIKANVSVGSLADAGPHDVSVQSPDGADAATCVGCFVVNDAPAVSIPDGLDPSSRGQGAKSHDVTIHGSGFTPGSVASFSGDGVTVESTTFTDANELVAKVSVARDATIGPRDVRVVNPDHGNVTCTGCFSVGRAPTVGVADPKTRGQGAKNEDISLVGEGFADGAVVSFGPGIAVNSTNVANPSSITAKVTIASDADAGKRDITVTNTDGGTDKCADCFSITNGPKVTSAEPSVNRGATNRVVALVGSGFDEKTNVDFSGTGITLNGLNHLSPTSLQANVSIDAGAPMGVRDITATNSDGGELVCAECFTVGDGPAVNSASPTAALNSGPRTITLNGFGFTPDSTVSLERNGRPDIAGSGVSMPSASQLKATFDLTWVSPGPWTVRVTTAGKSDTCRCFSVAQGAPNLASIAPHVFPQDASDRAITLTGTNFAPGATVSLSGNGVSIGSLNVESPTKITGQLSVDADAPSGQRDVTVTNTDGQDGACAGCVTVNTRPVISSINPTEQRQAANNKELTLVGDNFDKDSTVSFSGAGIDVSSVSFTDGDAFNPQDKLVAKFSIAPDATLGTRDIKVQNPDSGTAKCAECFTVKSTPTLASALPDARAQGAGTHDIVLTGTNFVDGAAVSFSGSGVSVESSKVDSLSKLTASVSVAPDAASGARDITVTNPDAGKVTCAGCFDVHPAPSLTELSPATRARGLNDQDITVTGTHLVGGTEVAVSGTGVTVNSVDVQSPTALLANVSIDSDAATGPRDVTVATPDGGSAICTDCFTVNVPPTLTSLSPASTGRGAKSHGITLIGQDLVDGASVSVSGGGVSVDSTQLLGVTKLLATLKVADDATPGLRDVTVTNPDGGEATCAGCFRVTDAQGRYTPLSPARILDTRKTIGGHNGMLGQGESYDVQVTGQGGVPSSGVSAVALNVTSVGSTSNGFFTIFPKGAELPSSTNVNFAAGETVPNLVVAKLGDGGKVTIFNSKGRSHALFDVQGWYSNQPAGDAGRYQPLSPARIADTRNGIGGRKGKVAAGKTMDVQVTGRGGVPASGVSAVVMNVTATNPTASSYLTAYPTGTAKPAASNLNFPAGRTVTNRVIAKVGNGGKVSMYNNAGTTDVIVDVSGWFTGATNIGDPGAFVPLVATRVVDTRSGLGGYSTKIGAGKSIDVQLTGQGGVPASGVAAVVMNLTATNVSKNTYVTAYPTGGAKPATSDLNPLAGRTMSNLVMVKVGNDGKATIYNNAGDTDVTVETLGYYIAP